MSLHKPVILMLLVSMAHIGYGQVKKTPAKPAAPAKPGTPPAIPAKLTTSLLWEISGRRLEKPSYLFGTMHILCEEDATLSPGLKKVISDVNEIFFEVDMDDMQEMMGALKYAKMNNGLKLNDLLTPIEYDRVKEYFDTHKSLMPFSMMSRLKPYFISAMIGEGMLGCEKKSGMEQKIMAEAKKYDKNILGLETLEFQASVFDSIPYEKQARDLITYIDSIDAYKKVTQDMVSWYRKQDVNTIDSLMLKSDPGMEQYMDLLLYSRNKRWRERITEQVYLGSTLFAVGAGHLGGEQGVIALLKEYGFTVKPIKN